MGRGRLDRRAQGRLFRFETGMRVGPARSAFDTGRPTTVRMATGKLRRPSMFLEASDGLSEDPVQRRYQTDEDVHGHAEDGARYGE